jgi:glycosyltransferase involved in cell wall biosynthesis
MFRKKPDLSLVIACYNEAEHLESSVARLLSFCDLCNISIELIFVDDCSTDGTRDILLALAEKHPSHSFNIQFNEKNLGRGATVRRGLELARAPIAGFLDIDLEVDAAYISSFYLAILRGADIAIGHRVYKLSLRSVPRFLLTRGYILLRDILVSLPFEDTEAGYKFFRMATAMPILEQCREPGWFWDTEVVARAYGAGLLIAEVTCLFTRRDDKTSTVRPIRDSWRQLMSLLALRRSQRSVAPSPVPDSPEMDR